MAANLERLKKRIKTLEEWVDENEAIAGPEGTLDTINYLISGRKQSDQMQAHLNQLQQYLQGFLNDNELMDKWNEYIMEKENNAVQEQSPEEIPSLTEAEDGEEVGEKDTKGKKPSKEEKSKETKK